jgi:Xaa-Pro aminopeptidase
MMMAVQSGASGAIPTFVDGPIPGAGITPAVPHGSTFKRVEKGVPVTIDYCSGYNGYWTDETRAFVSGELGEVFRKPYETARAILEDVLEYGKEGRDCTELWERAYALVRKAGLEENFMGHGEGQVSFLGHGVGLEINELPVVTAKHRRVLKEGMAIALEPKFVLPPYGAIGLEITIVVRADGMERITENPMDLVQA